MGAQRLVDLTELLGVLLGQRGHDRAELGQLGPHLGLDLVEPGVDHLVALAELGDRPLAGVTGGCAELLAIEHGRLLEHGPCATPRDCVRSSASAADSA